MTDPHEIALRARGDTELDHAAKDSIVIAPAGTAQVSDAFGAGAAGQTITFVQASGLTVAALDATGAFSAMLSQGVCAVTYSWGTSPPQIVVVPASGPVTLSSLIAAASQGLPAVPAITFSDGEVAELIATAGSAVKTALDTTYAPVSGIAKGALASGVQTTLAKADTASQPLTIPFGKFASSAQLDYSGETNTGIDAKVADLLNLGAPRPIWLHFNLGFDGSTLKIVQWGFTGTTQSEASVNYLVNALTTAGFTIAGIDLVVGWDGGIFSPYKYTASRAVMQKWVAVA